MLVAPHGLPEEAHAVMSTYVDWLLNHGWVIRGRPTASCHLFADSEQELETMARQLGLKPSWKQGGSLVHYDLVPAKRARAIELGAVELTRESFSQVYRRLRAANKASTKE